MFINASVLKEFQKNQCKIALKNLCSGQSALALRWNEDLWLNESSHMLQCYVMLKFVMTLTSRFVKETGLPKMQSASDWMFVFIERR